MIHLARLSIRRPVVALLVWGLVAAVLTAGGATMLLAGGALLYAAFRPEGRVSVAATAHAVQLQARF